MMNNNNIPGDPFGGTDPASDPFANINMNPVNPTGGPNNNNDNNNTNNNDPFTTRANQSALLAWQERQRRQRTLRMLMMFLMMLLLMDAEEPPDSNNNNFNRRNAHYRNKHHNMRRGYDGSAGGADGGNGSHGSSGHGAVWKEFGIYLDGSTGMVPPLDVGVFNSRRKEDSVIFKAIAGGGDDAATTGATTATAGENTDSSGYQRYNRLKQLNKGRDVELELRDWADKKIMEEAKSLARKSAIIKGSSNASGGDENDNEKQQNGSAASRSGSGSAKEDEESTESSVFAAREQIIKQLDDLPIYHYPRNATGYYRGLWLRLPLNVTLNNPKFPNTWPSPEFKEESGNSNNNNDNDNHNNKNTQIHEKDDESTPEPPKMVSLQEIHPWVQNQLHSRKEDISLLLLPRNTFLDDNATSSLTMSSPSKGKQNISTASMTMDEMKNLLASSTNSDDYLNGLLPGGAAGASASSSSYLRQSSTTAASSKPSSTATLSLTKDAGRAAFQLYSRPIPAMNEISIVDGLVKLYDGMTTSFVSRRTDVLLRVRGVMIHGIGKLSLVTATYTPGGDGWVAPVGGRRRSVLGVKMVGGGSDDDYDLKEAEKEVEKKVGGDEERGEKDMKVVGDSNSSAGENSKKKKKGPEDDDDDDFSVDSTARHRRLQETVDEVMSKSSTSGRLVDMMAQIRQDVMELYSSHYANNVDLDQDGLGLSREEMEKDGWSLLQTVEEVEDLFGDDDMVELVRHRRLESMAEEEAVENGVGSLAAAATDVESANNVSEEEAADAISSPTKQLESETVAELSILDQKIDTNIVPSTHRSALSEDNTPKPTIAQKYVYPFPYVHDDENDSIKKSSSPATRRLPSREQVLEANAANCEFEININVQESKWTYGEYRKTQEHRMRTVQAFNRYWNNVDSLKEIEKDISEDDKEMAAALLRLRKSHFLLVKSQLDFLEEEPPKEALVMTMIGNIESQNCNFNSFVNVTAIRTNWEHTTAKAINYSFYMMLTCLTQIVVLLRQLLHTQAQSAASNVSLLCIGWQTVLDAILCIGHIFLCLVMQPLFTAFASVAFFKLLIFCVIEMKYMAIIIQARNNTNNTGQTQEDLRRQITLLHLRFYGGLMGAIISFWYIGQAHRTLYVLLLYSFWVPQIVMNVITESRKPMHPYYIYGMSFTRVIAPLYTFAIESNFLKEVNPDFPTDLKMCQLLVLWVGIQTGVLILQGKYGTRFMIPQRFLPPKFDYSRPIPPSLLPRPSPVTSSSNGTPSEIELGPLLNGDASPSRERGTRNRRGGGNRARLGSRAEETIGTMSAETTETPTLDCVICYNEIDVNDRKGYMLAPCDHIFHKTCLEQWMEVKMECPICRKQLPSI